MTLTLTDFIILWLGMFYVELDFSTLGLLIVIPFEILLGFSNAHLGVSILKKTHCEKG